MAKIVPLSVTIYEHRVNIKGSDILPPFLCFAGVLLASQPLYLYSDNRQFVRDCTIQGEAQLAAAAPRVSSLCLNGKCEYSAILN